MSKAIPDKHMVELAGAENRYLRSRGWVPTLYKHSERGCFPCRVWVRDGAIYSHTRALQIQKAADQAKWEEMDRVHGELLPVNFGQTHVAPEE
jgi:hypothetical protein